MPTVDPPVYPEQIGDLFLRVTFEDSKAPDETKKGIIEQTLFEERVCRIGGKIGQLRFRLGLPLDTCLDLHERRGWLAAKGVARG
jgi:hypothetical protein